MKKCKGCLETFKPTKAKPACPYCGGNDLAPVPK